MLTLYQMPISHYCEKVRWALDHKGLEARVRNLLPGLHIRPAKKIAPRSHLPILIHDDRVIQNSADIITYLDQAFPEHPLTPEDSELRAEALHWEAVADEEIGPHLRRVVYHVVLRHPAVAIPLLTAHGPWYGSLLLRAVFPRLVKRMRSAMKIDDGTAAASLETVAEAVARINRQRGDGRYLVGNRFTRADLAAASLLAPIHQPPEYGVPWPKTLPADLANLTRELRDNTLWVLNLYLERRSD
jgi:glutathione S-transferase